MQNEEIDVVLLQEVAERGWRPNQAEEIAHLTGYGVGFAAAQRYFPWPAISTGIAVLSRFPMTNHLIMELCAPAGLIPLGMNERRVAQRVEISLDGMSVVIFNTHFPLTAEGRLASALRLWGQIVQEEAILVIVGGDLNARPDEAAITFLQGKVPQAGMRGTLVDAWVTAGIGPAETFPAASPQARIDYILYQGEPAVAVQETKVVGLPPQEMSDHAAVVATFSISPPRGREMPFEEEPVASLEPTGGGHFGSY